MWTEWDFILLRVHQYMEDYTTQNGHPIWVEEDPDVGWDITTSESFLERERDEYMQARELKPWQHIRMTPVVADGAEPPSMEKWLKRLEEDEGTGFKFPEGERPRPPTAEELARMRGLDS